MNLDDLRLFPNFRKSGQRLRVPTTFATSGASLTVWSKRALIRTGDLFLRELRNESFSAREGQYPSLTVEPIDLTVVGGEAAPGPGVQINRFCASSNGERAAMPSLSFIRYAREEVHNSANAIYALAPGEEARVVGGQFLVYRLTSAVDTVGVVTLFPSNQQAVLTHEAYPFGFRIDAGFPVGVWPALSTYILRAARSTGQIENLQIDPPVVSVPSRPADFVAQGHDVVSYSDGIGGDATSFNPVVGGEAIYEGAFRRPAGPSPWKRLDAGVRSLRSPAFVVMVAKLNDDFFDQYSRIEFALGRDAALGPLQTIEQVASLSFMRGKPVCCGLQTYVAGFDMTEPFDYVRVRSLYPPYMSSGSQPAGHVQFYAIPWEHMDFGGSP